MPTSSVAEFAAAVGVSFASEALLKQAFTHRSYLNEHKKLVAGHNERLEFLGDAVLELAVTEYLYTKYPEDTEGDLTSYRAALVNANTLGDIAAELEMGKYLLLSKGEAKDKGRARQYILANAFEAFVGALFLDQGYDVARDFIARTVLPLTDKVVSEKLWLDAKSHFQEKAQEIEGTTPSYQVMKEEGPDHDKHFTVAVYIGRDMVARGEGKSKQEAEQSAARAGLKARAWM